MKQTSPPLSPLSPFPPFPLPPCTLFNQSHILTYPLVSVHTLHRGHSATFVPPSLILTVSGTVSHHIPESSSALAPTTSTAPKSATASTHGANRNRGNFDPDAPITSHPRAFSQNFVLVDAAQVGAGEGGVACASTTGKDGGITLSGKFFVQADNFRFVG